MLSKKGNSIISSSARLSRLATFCLLVEFFLVLASYVSTYGDLFLQIFIDSGLWINVFLPLITIGAYTAATLARTRPSLVANHNMIDISAFVLSGVKLVLFVPGIFMALSYGAVSIIGIINCALLIAAPVLLYKARSEGGCLPTGAGQQGTGEYASVDDGFSMAADTDRKAICFSVKGSGIGFGAWFGFIFGGVFFGLILAFLFVVISPDRRRYWGTEDFFSAWIVLFAIAMIWAFLLRIKRSRIFRFDITDVDVQTPDGQHYARSDISEILLRNKGTILHHSQANITPIHSPTMVVGTGMVGGAFVAGHAVGRAAEATGQALGQIGRDVGVLVKNSLTKRSYEVCIRHGRKVIPLARYLREDDAISLFNKVAEVL